MIAANAEEVTQRRQGLPRTVDGAPSGGNGPVPEGYVVASSVTLPEASGPAQGGSATGAAAPAVETSPVAGHAAAAHTPGDSVVAPAPQPATAAGAALIVAGETSASARRSGLPRVTGGAPSGGSGPVPEAYRVAQNIVLAAEGETPAAVTATVGSSVDTAPPPAVATAPTTNAAAVVSVAAASTGATAAIDPAVALRRQGLPRVAGETPSGGAGPVPESYVIASSVALPGIAGEEEAPAAAATTATEGALVDPPAAAAITEVASEAAPAAAPAQPSPAAPASVTKTAAAAKPAKPAKPPVDPEKRMAQLKMLGAAVVGAVIAVAGVMVVRALLTTDPFQSFLERYPGEYALPESAEPGFPAWVKWTHFLNFFFMVLIVRSGLQVRYQKKPDAYWTPKWSKNGDGKVSLAAWFHQALDILWIANGVTFVVLLIVSGHWMRIVPTSWEVFPNLVSAALQYVSLDWPTEDGWINYNSLQQVMYFLVVFVAAPLAAITGVRMSGIWPKKAEKLSKLYPIELARAIHFPTMLFFVFFVIVHVVLVFTTGALRNLNHMFGEGPVTSWVGLGIFAVSIAVTIGAWIAARPMVLATIAGLFGRVSNR